MTIRPATNADVPGIGLIWNAAIRDTTITFNPVEKTQAEIAGTIQSTDPFFA